MDNAFEIGSSKFQLGKINAFKQFHIVRRMAPILAELAPAIGEMSKASKLTSGTEVERFNEIAKFAAPLMNGLAKLSDEDANRILFGLLSSVEIQGVGGIWSKVANDTTLLFENLELPVLLQVAGRAFAYNMTGFFAALPRV